MIKKRDTLRLRKKRQRPGQVKGEKTTDYFFQLELAWIKIYFQFELYLLFIYFLGSYFYFL